MEEQARLARVTARLQAAIDEASARLRDYARDLEEQKAHMWDHRDEMDHIEKIAARDIASQAVATGDAVVAQRTRLEKLIRSPYFARFDFARAGANAPLPVYIGVHHFHDDRARETLVYDWRAPIASMFYDHEPGPAAYVSPDGEVRGELQRKRQFRIRDGNMELMIESDVNVVDDVLQDELGRASDDAMRNIVATIQRDQNAIIRNEHTRVLVIQGVAGSGKTSIALHRIAYLLYRFKDTLSSEDILIISPNRVFADYISDVLPELGEESVREIDMATLADALLDGAYRFQTFFEQTTALLEKDEKDDDGARERIRFKASPDFLRQLDDHVSQLERERFVGEDLWIARRLLPGWLLEETYRKHRRMSVTERIGLVVRELEQRIGIEYRYDLTPEERRALREGIRGMVREQSLRNSYRSFFERIGRPELFRLAGRGRLEYADVFPLIYLKMRLEGIDSPWRNIRHLLIDEMQDYTPVQYAVIARLFACNKTILGDAHQAVNPYSASTAAQIESVFREAVCVSLHTSYRSTWEITRFAQRVLPNPELIAIERHGPEPQVLAFADRRRQLEAIRAAVDDFRASGHNTLAILCRTQKQAERMATQLRPEDGSRSDVQLLNEASQSFGHGVVVCTAYMAKGLEFDRVLVTDASDDNYRTQMDRHLLYVACTRARHLLTLTHTGAPTSLIEN